MPVTIEFAQGEPVVGPTGPQGPQGAAGAAPTTKQMIAYMQAAGEETRIVGSWTITDVVVSTSPATLLATVIDVNKNGSSIFLNYASQPKIDSGLRSQRTGSFNVSTLTNDDRLSFDIDETGAIFTRTLQSVCYGNGKFVMVGSSVTSLGGTQIWTSTDGVSWTRQAIASTASLQSVVYIEATSLFVAGGSGGVFATSPDGANWTFYTAAKTQQTWYGVAYNPANGKYVFAGYNTILPTMSVLATTSDFSTWTETTISNALRGVIYSSSDSMFIAFGDNNTTYWTSSDGTTWTTRTHAMGASTYGMVYVPSKDLYVAVGASGKIATSADGVSWTSRTSGTTSNLNAVAYNPSLDLIVAVGFVGRISTSSDGTTWGGQAFGFLGPNTTTPSTIWTGVACSTVSGRCSAVGYWGSNPLVQEIATTVDGQLWSLLSRSDPRTTMSVTVWGTPL